VIRLHFPEQVSEIIAHFIPPWSDTDKHNLRIGRAFILVAYLAGSDFPEMHLVEHGRGIAIGHAYDLAERLHFLDLDLAIVF
tara:strand:- start:42 stop:287 length:246 start_codon:yes stop_codon:yes gene_type:complete